MLIVLKYQIRILNTLLLNYHLPKPHISAFIIASLDIFFGLTRGSITSGAMKRMYLNKNDIFFEVNPWFA